MSWKKGPLPAGTWQWGGVMLVGQPTNCFHFADFHGDHVCLPCEDNKRVEAADVAFYNNCLDLPLPPECGGTLPKEGEKFGRVGAVALLLISLFAFSGCTFGSAELAPNPKGAEFKWDVEEVQAAAPVVTETTAPAAQPAHVHVDCDCAAKWKDIEARVSKLESPKADNAGPPQPSKPATVHSSTGGMDSSGGCADGECGRSGIFGGRLLGRRR